MNTNETIGRHYVSGQHAAIRCRRALCNAPTKECHKAWYTGFDSVPPDLRGKGPLTGPIPIELLSGLAAAEVEVPIE